MRIDKLYRNGHSLREIAEIVGVSHSTVRKRLIAMGVEMKPIKKYGIIPADKKKIMKMYEEGTSKAKIGRVMDMDIRTVRNIIQEER